MSASSNISGGGKVCGSGGSASEVHKISRRSGSWIDSVSLGLAVTETFVRRDFGLSGPSLGGSEPLLAPASALGVVGASDEFERSVEVDTDVEDTRRLVETRVDNRDGCSLRDRRKGRDIEESRGW